MSVELDELSKSLYNGHLPSIWRALAPATLKSLGNWMIHFLRRNTQYQQWVSPYAFNMSIDSELEIMFEHQKVLLMMMIHFDLTYVCMSEQKSNVCINFF